MNKTHIKISVKNDFRKFKKGQIMEFDIQRMGITYLTGKNGKGKTTILTAFRNIKDSLKYINKEIFDGIIPQEIEHNKIDTENGFEIDGFEYDEVFALDSVVDDPLSFQNAATAFSLCSGGGFHMMKMSKGEKALILFCNFIKKIEKFLEKYSTEELYAKKNLILIDEVDEGFDASLQMKFNDILFNKLILPFNADVLVVTHNTLCMLSPSLFEPSLYDLETLEETTPNKYFERKTGYKIEIKKIEENEQKKSENCKQITEP